mmetsp:Transcript_12798/g.36345  ORF Transcript_12798/g.36345 Transcript_12798/m.36345 type:complete len:295 (-) Transcript_12798:191-1075(-)
MSAVAPVGTTSDASDLSPQQSSGSTSVVPFLQRLQGMASQVSQTVQGLRAAEERVSRLEAGASKASDAVQGWRAAEERMLRLEGGALEASDCMGRLAGELAAVRRAQSSLEARMGTLEERLSSVLTSLEESRLSQPSRAGIAEGAAASRSSSELGQTQAQLPASASSPTRSGPRVSHEPEPSRPAASTALPTTRDDTHAASDHTTSTSAEVNDLAQSLAVAGEELPPKVEAVSEDRGLGRLGAADSSPAEPGRAPAAAPLPLRSLSAGALGPAQSKQREQRRAATGDGFILTRL